MFALVTRLCTRSRWSLTLKFVLYLEDLAFMSKSGLHHLGSAWYYLHLLVFTFLLEVGNVLLDSLAEIDVSMGTRT